jgi:glycerol uptake facilitator-like aquaporin
MYTIMQKYLAEFLGTLFFVYVILYTGNPLAIGAALAIAIFLSASMSGGHINPAVSVVMAAKGRISTTDLIPYIIAQILGGLVALEIYKKWKP